MRRGQGRGGEEARPHLQGLEGRRRRRPLALQRLHPRFEEQPARVLIVRRHEDVEARQQLRPRRIPGRALQLARLEGLPRGTEVEDLPEGWFDSDTF